MVYGGTDATYKPLIKLLEDANELSQVVIVIEFDLNLKENELYIKRMEKVMEKVMSQFQKMEFSSINQSKK